MPSAVPMHFPPEPVPVSVLRTVIQRGFRRWFVFPEPRLRIGGSNAAGNRRLADDRSGGCVTR